jgi:hypothetical protein
MHLQVFKPYLISASVVSIGHATPEHPRVHNANHLFNAIHSSMRQWGSSLNHNGMPFFLATVPAGTQLYHGTSRSEPIEGMEWLAFEPEHGLLFARPNRGPPGDNHGSPKDEEDYVGEHGQKPHYQLDMPHDGPRPPPETGNGKIYQPAYRAAN